MIIPKEEELWVSGGRISQVLRSLFDNVERGDYTAQHWPDSWMEIPPQDARNIGIEKGDQVLIYSDRAVELKEA
jgi:arsenite oxidase large subunit